MTYLSSLMLIYDYIYVDVLGLIITGSKNWDARYAAEVFKVGSAQSCLLPQLPNLSLRRYHTQVLFDNNVNIYMNIISLEWKLTLWWIL